MTEKKVFDLELMLKERSRIMDSEAIHGRESDVVQLFIESFQTGNFEDRIPMGEHDTIVGEFVFRYGRADIVVFHADGSASVIEVKDGTKGYGHVVAGIGQVALYACQLAMTKVSLTKVRKCLLWTSVGSVDADAVIEEACEGAGVVALPWPSLKILMANKEAVRRVIMGRVVDGRS